MTLHNLRVPAAIVVGCVWTLSFIDGLVTKDFVALGITTPVAMVAAAAVFAVKVANGNGANGKT